MWAQTISYHVYDSSDQWIKNVIQFKEARREAARLGVGAYTVRFKQKINRDGMRTKLETSNQASVIRTCLNCNCKVTMKEPTRCEMLAMIANKRTWLQFPPPTKRKPNIHDTWCLPE